MKIDGEGVANLLAVIDTRRQGTIEEYKIERYDCGGRNFRWSVKSSDLRVKIKTFSRETREAK